MGAAASVHLVDIGPAEDPVVPRAAVKEVLARPLPTARLGSGLSMSRGGEI